MPKVRDVIGKIAARRPANLAALGAAGPRALSHA